MKKISARIPVPIAGLMLALAASGNLIASYGQIYKNIFGAASFLILILLAAKIFIHTEDVLESLKNPVVASVSPTFSMGIMILSTYMVKYSATTAFYVWLTGLLLHFVLLAYFSRRFIFNFEINKVFPSYFVVYVGFVVASVTAPPYGLQNIGRILFWVGLVLYLVLLPIVTYRVLKVKTIPQPALPTLAIFAAPASLCLAGYMTSFEEKSLAMVIFLMVLSLIMTLAVLILMPKIMKNGFYPSYSAFTFPLVISAIAMKKTNAFFVSSGNSVLNLKYIVLFEEALAVLIVIYVLFKYMVYLSFE